MVGAVGNAAQPGNRPLRHSLRLCPQFCFVNVLGLGFDARVIRRVQRRGRCYLRGRTAFLLAVLEELLGLRPLRIQGEIDARAIAAEVNLFSVGLGRYCGGLRITPQASPRTGRFQVVWLGRLSRFEALDLLPAPWLGRHLDHPKAHQGYGTHLQVQTKPPVRIEAEGELLGRTPLTVELYRSAFHLARTLASSI